MSLFTVAMLLCFWPKLVTWQSSELFVGGGSLKRVGTAAVSITESTPLSADVSSAQWLCRTEWWRWWGTPLSLLLGLTHILLHQRPAGWPQAEPP